MSLAQVSDVDKAVAAAKDAFEHGLWGKISARDRGRLLYRWDLARTHLPVPGLPLRPRLALTSSCEDAVPEGQCDHGLRPRGGFSEEVA